MPTVNIIEAAVEKKVVLIMGSKAMTPKMATNGVAAILISFKRRCNNVGCF